MKRSLFALLALGFIALLTGCAGYQRGSTVPQELRTINVPAFENKTKYPMVGAVSTQQFLDIMIEDGTFTPATYETARLKMQVVVDNCYSDSVRYDRNNVIIPSEYYLTLQAKLFVYDAQTGETYINGKPVSVTEPMLTRNQYQTAVTDTLPRIARKLAKALLDELHTIQ